MARSVDSATETGARRLALVTEMPLSPAELAAAAEALPEFDIVCTTKRDDALTARAEVIAGALDAGSLRRAGALRWNHIWTAGAENAMASELADRGVVLTCSVGNGAAPLAEHVLMLMLMLSRDVPRMMRAQAGHRWEPFEHAELAGRTVGILGLGNIGRAVAVRCRAFEMEVLAVRNRLGVGMPPCVDEMFGQEDLRRVLARSDFVVVTAPLTDRTRGMVGAAELGAMRPSAFLVNVSRGEVVDEGALLRALRDGAIAGAGLDAHAREPLPRDSPWWSLPNVVVTPHLGSLADGTRRRTVEIFLENLVRYGQGAPLENVVDPALGYPPPRE